ncbi:MAG: hypothetical protein GC145_17645 [Caulobacter sp.]|nr:hypothetical protein [Caulobacter sp.]
MTTLILIEDALHQGGICAQGRRLAKPAFPTAFDLLDLALAAGHWTLPEAGYRAFQRQPPRQVSVRPQVIGGVNRNLPLKVGDFRGLGGEKVAVR